MLSEAEKAAGYLPKAALLMGLVVFLAASPLSLAGPIGASTARALTSGHPSHSTHAAPTSLNLLPSAGAVLKPPHPRAFEEPAEAVAHFRDLDERTSHRDGLNSHVAFPVKWENDPANLSPQVVSLARNFRRNGLPILHLWASGRNLLAVGLNSHGRPGIYFTQNMD